MLSVPLFVNFVSACVRFFRVRAFCNYLMTFGHCSPPGVSSGGTGGAGSRKGREGNHGVSPIVASRYASVGRSFDFLPPRRGGSGGSHSCLLDTTVRTDTFRGR